MSAAIRLARNLAGLALCIWAFVVLFSHPVEDLLSTMAALGLMFAAVVVSGIYEDESR